MAKFRNRRTGVAMDVSDGSRLSPDWVEATTPAPEAEKPKATRRRRTTKTESK